MGRHSGEATEQDRIDLIYQATRYGKDTGTRILFFSSDGQVMFEDELGLKTEVYCSKTYLVIVAVVVVSLLFPALFIAVPGCRKSEIHHRVRRCDCSPGQSIPCLGASDMEIQDHSRGGCRNGQACGRKNLAVFCVRYNQGCPEG